MRLRFTIIPLIVLAIAVAGYALGLRTGIVTLVGYDSETAATV